MQDYSEIQNAFLDGFEDIFTIMFTDRLELQLLDEESTEKNIYDEAPSKVYLPPIQLVGRIRIDVDECLETVEGEQRDAVITIPAKQLITKNIPHGTSDDLDRLRRAKFVYDGFEYLVEFIKPKTLIADKWQLYEFDCHGIKKSSLRGV